MVATNDDVLRILHVEDDDIDREALQRGFEEAGFAHQITGARDGLEALDLLRAGKPGVERPCLVLLDLNMPRMDGIEFLDALRGDPELAGTVVFVVTTSSSEDDRARAYARHVSGYIAKSAVGADFRPLAEMLRTYWRLVELPVGR